MNYEQSKIWRVSAIFQFWNWVHFSKSYNSKTNWDIHKLFFLDDRAFCLLSLYNASHSCILKNNIFKNLKNQNFEKSHLDFFFVLKIRNSQKIQDA